MKNRELFLKDPVQSELLNNGVAEVRDIQSHSGNTGKAITAVRNWLTTESQLLDCPGGSFIIRQYRRFKNELPDLCRRAKLRVSEVSFKDYCDLVAVWLRTNA